MYATYDLVIPESLRGALDLLAYAPDDGTLALAGGTNLIVDIRARRARPDHVVGLGRIDELRGLRSNDRQTVIGARTTASELLASPEIAARAPSLIDAAKLFGGQMVRNAATIAGNIACGSPAADLVPPLMSLDAVVTLASASGSRSIALDAYYRGYKEDVRRPDELITEIAWSHLPPRSTNVFYKLARRVGDAITITGVAVTLAVADGVCTRARIALGAVAPVPLRAKKAEGLIEGMTLDARLIADAAAQAAAECSPIDDVRASADYRRHTVEALTRRLVTQSWEQLS